MVTEAAPDTNRPYTPPSNLIAVLHRLRSRNLPERVRVDAEYLRDASVSEGTVGRTLFGLRFLGLTDDVGEPTQALRSMHTSTDEEYRTILAGVMREAYSEVFAVIDPGEDTQDHILNFFRRYTPASQRSRMVVFFLGMCREAGIPTLDVPRQRSMREPKSSSAQPATSRRVRKPPSQGQSGGAPATTGIHPALEGLVRSLPDPGKPLSQERLEQWLTMAKATLSFIYPEEEEAPEVSPEAEQEAVKP